jgi:uncharacterized membrane protein YdfJ with MMPL/SSD domain
VRLRRFRARSSRELQLFGFGLAVAVLIDATVVRMILAPLIMEMLGDRTWWLPHWLDRVLPRVTIERATDGSGRGDEREGATTSSNRTVSLHGDTPPALQRIPG